MDFILADSSFYDVGYIDVRKDIDVDIGETDDFVMKLYLDDYKVLFGDLENPVFYVPNTEYGGIIADTYTPPGQDTIELCGDTWRGMLRKKIIKPPSGSDYLLVSGDAHSIMRDLLTDAFDGMFVVPAQDCGIVFENYQFDRYVDFLDGFTKMLFSKMYRLNIEYKTGRPGHVEISAVPITDYSDTMEYSEDYGNISFSTRDVRNGINHLICLGKGDLKERQVIDLYVQSDGSIGSEQYFFGMDEREAIYDYKNAESIADLESKGVEYLTELMGYKLFDMTVRDSVAEIGDIVGGRERATNLVIKQQITQKIIQVKNNRVSVEHKVGGPVKLRAIQ